MNRRNIMACIFVILLLISCSSSDQTTLSYMGNLENPLPECPSSPNCERVSLSFERDSSSVFLAFTKVLNNLSAEEIKSNQDELRIDAVFKIPIFGFRDDVNVALKNDGNSTAVFIRSASREGHWDIWVNKLRVKKIIKLTKQTLSK